MQIKLHPSQAIDPRDSLVYVCDTAWADFEGAQFINHAEPPKAQNIQANLLHEAILEILKSVQQENRYILASIGTDINDKPSSKTPVGVFKISEEILTH